MTPPRQRKPAGQGLSVSAVAVDDWAAIREHMRTEFQGRAHAWLTARWRKVLTWPEDERALISQVGVPCVDCLEIVSDPDDGRHVVRCLSGEGGGHWAAGITAACGAEPAGRTSARRPARRVAG